MPQYWVTTHWPHPKHGDHPWHIYLREGHEELAESVRRQDAVLFYETLGGATRLKELPNGTLEPVPIPRGRGGIVRVGEVTGRYHPQTALPPIVRPVERPLSRYFAS